MVGAKAKKDVIVRGIVTAVDWEENGEVRAVALLTDDEDQYEVEPDEVGLELVDYLQEEVAVRGTLRSVGGGAKIIRVKDFEPYARDEDEEDYEGEELN